jgi:hypothetical protein
MKALIEAIVSKLRSTVGVTALVGQRVHKALPTSVEPSRFPAITISPISGLAWDTKDMVGHEETIAVHTWTHDDRTYDKANQIMDAVHSALHQAALTVSGQTVVLVRIEYREGPSVDPDDATLSHGIQRIRVITHV